MFTLHNMWYYTLDIISRYTVHGHNPFRLGNHTFSGGAAGLILLIPPLKR
jgi:hypothetical protein